MKPNMMITGKDIIILQVEQLLTKSKVEADEVDLYYRLDKKELKTVLYFEEVAILTETLNYESFNTILKLSLSKIQKIYKKENPESKLEVINLNLKLKSKELILVGIDSKLTINEIKF